MDLVGQKFGRLIVISRTDQDRWGKYRWLCQCSCGGEAITTSYCLKTGHTKSCGCLVKEGSNIRHGHLKKRKTSPTYTAWAHIIQRCTNPKNKNYKYYGGRGIKVCQRWMKFENFLRDMGEKPAETQIDRTDNNKGYFADNCSWATRKQQCRNRRSNHLETYQGKTKTMIEWAEETGILYDTIRFRLKRGWSIEKALATPAR